MQGTSWKSADLQHEDLWWACTLYDDFVKKTYDDFVDEFGIELDAHGA